MKEEPSEALDPALSALLESERHAVPPSDSLGRVWARIAVLPAIGVSGGRGGGAAHGWLASHAIGVAAIAFVTGGAAGATLYAAVQKPLPERIVYVDRPAPIAPVTAPSAPLPVPAIPIATPSPVATAAPLPSTHTTPAPSSTSLSAERALLDSARGALASGDASGALVLLGDHAHKFPKAQLAEEREALVIQSLVTLGRYEEARAAAARFKAASPGSLFMPAIEASLGSIP